MEDHETRRKIIREWMALPKDKRHTEEQVVAFAKKATQQNEFHRSRRDPDHQFRRDPYRKIMGWLLPRAGNSIGDPMSVERTFARIEGVLGEVNVLLYNVGAGMFEDVETITPDQFGQAWRVNAYGALLCAARPYAEDG
jgi:NAD(P)-dependent dehydrogenase (short-subunit alcohol dehydrogenase family)